MSSVDKKRKKKSREKCMSVFLLKRVEDTRGRGREGEREREREREKERKGKQTNEGPKKKKKKIFDKQPGKKSCTDESLKLTFY